MKLRHIGQAAWAGAVSVALVLGVAACGQDNTIDYLFVANSKNNPGQINVYLVDSESGSLKQILDSPYQSGQTNGGRNPVSLVTSPNQQYLYALNHDDNTIVKFGIGTDAKLYPQNTYNTPGSGPDFDEDQCRRHLPLRPRCLSARLIAQRCPAPAHWSSIPSIRMARWGRR